MITEGLNLAMIVLKQSDHLGLQMGLDRRRKKGPDPARHTTLVF